MRTHAHRFVLPAAILAAAALSAGAAAAAEPLALPEGSIPLGVTVAEAAALADAASAASADTGAAPASRLLRSLGEHAEPPASSPSPAEGRGTDPVSGPAGTQVAGILHGCPRALLGSLLASAAETPGPVAGDAVVALGIERETLALCRERQEIVNGIVALEVELGALLAEAAPADAGVPAPAASAAAVETPVAPIVKEESAPVRVVSLPPVDDDAGESPEEKPESVPAPPAYAWFSIVGTAGDLRAGIGDDTGKGGARVWFVREGDRLPGGVTVTRIAARPPGVHVEGAVEAALPYSPRPSAVAGPRRDAEGDGS